MPEINNPDAIVSTERVLSFAPKEVFAAFQQPELLAQWWGPNGFSNTFELFEFAAGGRWVFMMHGPNGADYPNESIFQELLPNEKIVIRHTSPPQFTLTIALASRGDGTYLTWNQEFDSAEVAATIRRMYPSANDENLDRLQAVLRGETSLG